MHTPCMYFPTLLRPHTSLIFLFLPPAVAKGGGRDSGGGGGGRLSTVPPS